MTPPSRRPLRVAVAQPACRPGDVAANAEAHAALVRAAGARVVVFPEMSLTGYELDAPVVPSGDPRLAPLVDACAATGAVALCGAPVAGGVTGTGAVATTPPGTVTGTGARVGARPHIAVVAVDGAGDRVAYRKMWLGDAEAVRFAPGDEPGVVRVDGWRLGLAVCKDTGIVRHAADTVARGIDVYVAGVLEHDHEAAVVDERVARIAADHHVPLVVASFAGSTGGGYTLAAGRSGVWAADGRALARAGADVGEVVAADLT